MLIGLYTLLYLANVENFLEQINRTQLHHDQEDMSQVRSVNIAF